MATPPQRKRTTKEQLEERPGEGDADTSRGLEKDGGDSTYRSEDGKECSVAHFTLTMLKSGWSRQKYGTIAVQAYEVRNCFPLKCKLPRNLPATIHVLYNEKKD